MGAPNIQPKKISSALLSAGREPTAPTSAAPVKKRMPQRPSQKISLFNEMKHPPPSGRRGYSAGKYTPGTYVPQDFDQKTEFNAGEFARTAPEFSATGYVPGEFVAPERSYGGGIPPEARDLADALAERGEMINRRTMESELLGFGGRDAVSSPMARFQALREAELAGELNRSVLGLLHGSAEAGRERRHQAGMQDQELATQRFLTEEQLGTQRNIAGNQMRLEQVLQDAAAENQRFMQGEQLGTERYISDAARELQRYLQGEQLGTQRFMQGEQLGTQRFMQDRDIRSKHFLDSLMRRERYDDREIAARNRNQELLLALMGGTPSHQGKSGSTGFRIWG